MNKLKKAREKLGLKQDEAAEAIGISYSLYQKMEQGLKTGNDDTKQKVATFFKLPIGYLFFNEEITKRDKEVTK